MKRHLTFRSSGHGPAIVYAELRCGRWEKIPISGEMLGRGEAHHVIYFSSLDWSSYPDWAKHRRDEIVSRIKSEFQAPNYYYN